MPQKYDSYWDLLDPVWDDLSLSIDDADSWFKEQARHPQPLIHLYSTHFCQSEVRNGGFEQFFFNSTGMIGPEAVEGFSAIGMTRAGQELLAACNKLGSEYPRDRFQRCERLLAAAGRNMEDLAAETRTSMASIRAFQYTREFSRAFSLAVKPVDLRTLEKEFFTALNEEGGGFEAAADTYANSIASSN